MQASCEEQLQRVAALDRERNEALDAVSFERQRAEAQDSRHAAEVQQLRDAAAAKDVQLQVCLSFYVD